MDYLSKIFLVTCLCLWINGVLSTVYLVDDGEYEHNLKASVKRNKRQTHHASTVAKFSSADDVFTPIVGQLRQPLHQDDQRFSSFSGLAETVDLTQPQDAAADTLVDYLTPPSPSFQHPAPNFNPSPSPLLPSPLPPSPSPLLPTIPPPDFSIFGSASHFSSTFQAPSNPTSNIPQARELTSSISVDNRPFQPTQVNDQGKWDLGFEASEILNPPVEGAVPTRHFDDGNFGPPPSFRRPVSQPLGPPSFAASHDSPVSFSSHNQFRDFSGSPSVNNFPASPPHSPRHANGVGEIIWGTPKPNSLSQPPNTLSNSPFFNGLDSPPSPPPSFRQPAFNSFNSDSNFKFTNPSQATFTTKAPPPFNNFDSFVPQGSVRDNGFLTPPIDGFNHHTKRQSEHPFTPQSPKLLGPLGTRSFHTKRHSVDPAGQKRRSYKKRRSNLEAEEEVDDDEGRKGEHVKTPVYSFVKTDKHGHFKWGVRQGLPNTSD